MIGITKPKRSLWALLCGVIVVALAGIAFIVANNPDLVPGLPPTKDMAPAEKSVPTPPAGVKQLSFVTAQGYKRLA